MTMLSGASIDKQVRDASNLAIALITASVTLLVAIVSTIIGYFISKTREKETNWRNLKIAFYKDFVGAHAGMASGDATDEDRLRFSRSCNRISLVASRGVLDTLSAYLKEISISNLTRSLEKETTLRNRLIWEMRKDIGYIPNKTPIEDFVAPFNTSGNRRT